eukprot:TRINITY_DN46042_c0_g1_i1.p1 TRINITY_DN46042_c0_g1~~TRINITY_DN46042_c0_g1_i1.p1  ORF type:complete len:354 (-),score=36.00 TRINITY_DN46042_c0_g1_i1:374-1384(-)
MRVSSLVLITYAVSLQLASTRKMTDACSSNALDEFVSSRNPTNMMGWFRPAKKSQDEYVIAQNFVKNIKVKLPSIVYVAKYGCFASCPISLARLVFFYRNMVGMMFDAKETKLFLRKVIVAFVNSTIQHLESKFRAIWEEDNKTYSNTSFALASQDTQQVVDQNLTVFELVLNAFKYVKSRHPLMFGNSKDEEIPNVVSDDPANVADDPADVADKVTRVLESIRFAKQLGFTPETRQKLVDAIQKKMASPSSLQASDDDEQAHEGSALMQIADANLTQLSIGWMQVYSLIVMLLGVWVPALLCKLHSLWASQDQWGGCVIILLIAAMAAGLTNDQI